MSAGRLGGGARLFALGHVGDDDADADHLVGAVPDRVVADEPVAQLARGCRGVACGREIEDRVAAVEHPPVVRLDRRSSLVPEHLAERPAEVLLGREAVDRRERLVHAHEAEVGVHEGEAHWRRGEERVDHGQRVLGVAPCRLGLAEESRVVDRRRGAACEVTRDGEIALVVAAAALGRDEGDRPEHPVARDERHAHRGAQA